MKKGTIIIEVWLACPIYLFIIVLFVKELLKELRSLWFERMSLNSSASVCSNSANDSSSGSDFVPLFSILAWDIIKRPVRINLYTLIIKIQYGHKIHIHLNITLNLVAWKIGLCLIWLFLDTTSWTFEDFLEKFSGIPTTSWI